MREIRYRLSNDLVVKLSKGKVIALERQNRRINLSASLRHGQPRHFSEVQMWFNPPEFFPDFPHFSR